MDIFFSLVNNTALLMSLCIVYEVSYLLPSRFERFKPVLNGIFIGFIGFVIMLFPFQLESGIIFDTRSILIGVSAFVFGPVPTAIVVAVTGFYRILLGGAGALTGVSVVIMSAAVGLIWRKAFKKTWLGLYCMGLVIHVLMLACMYLMPLATASAVISAIALPVMLIYPVGTVLLSVLLIHQRERHEFMQKLESAESRYKAFFEHGCAVILMIDPKTGTIVDANEAAAKFYGWPRDLLRNMNVAEIAIQSPEDIYNDLQSTVCNEKSYFVQRHKTAADIIRDVEIFCGPIQQSQQLVVYAIVHDISERIAAHEALKTNEENLKLLIAQMQQGLAVHEILFDSEGKPQDLRYLLVNEYFLRLVGAVREELVGKTISEYFPEASHFWLEKCQEVLQSGETQHFETYSKILEKYLDVVIYQPQRDRFAVIATDITERAHNEKLREEMSAQLMQQQKLEAIGTLASGVAHEINNSINGIMNYAQLIADETDSKSEENRYAREIIHETERVAEIVRNLLQFSRQEKKSHSYASIYDIISGTISLINTVIRKDQITLQMTLEEGLPSFKCRSQQIQQVIMNLLTNARDALNEKYPEPNPNKIISLSVTQFEEADTKWLRITVEDRGKGIPEEVRQKIYEPFFSTKPKDKGTGLGLSISFGIIKDHHGKIHFETEAGEYTRFFVDLPVDNGWELEEKEEQGERQWEKSSL